MTLRDRADPRARPLHWIGVRIRQEPRLFIDTGDWPPLTAYARPLCWGATTTTSRKFAGSLRDHS